jgi:hypothetical protein
MIDRVKDKFDLDPERIIADTAYGSGPMLGWLVDRKIAPHIPFSDKASRNDGSGIQKATTTSAQKVSRLSNLAATAPIPIAAQTRRAGQNIAD